MVQAKAGLDGVSAVGLSLRRRQPGSLWRSERSKGGFLRESGRRIGGGLFLDFGVSCGRMEMVSNGSEVRCSAV